MRLVILITVFEIAAIVFWLLYRYHGRRRSVVSAETVSPSIVSTIDMKPDPVSTLRDSYWSFINQWRVEDQRDDRQPVGGSASLISRTGPSAGRAFARQSHQLMYKKWSQDRHD